MGNSFGCSASGERLVAAARDGDLVEAKMLLEFNPSLAKYSTFGGLNSPLHFAASKGHNEIMALLLEKGADVNSRNYCGQTALMQACRHGHWEVVQTLMLYRCNVMKADYLSGRTTLHFATVSGHVRCIRLVVADFVPSAPYETLHVSVDADYPDNPIRQQKKDVKELVQILSRMYPCSECANHFKEVLRSNHVQSGSHAEFSQWLCHVHNVVNRSIGKPISCIEKYKDGGGRNLLENLNNRERQIREIEASFEAAKSRPVHATKKDLYPVEFMPLLPNIDRYDDQFVLAAFDNAPTADSEMYRKLDKSICDISESRAVMKSYVVTRLQVQVAYKILHQANVKYQTSDTYPSEESESEREEKKKPKQILIKTLLISSRHH
ncbi:hypothetical protein KIW84_045288 [Lathyrus oleraceus]|uniref:Sulfhydryl oxidase n=1 Tax=Pisum sativum TaxID=3888 RepID=A0A9D5AX23_PEA|nr:hypothetical protein KIW84_045288 [Pisum sativum]